MMSQHEKDGNSSLMAGSKLKNAPRGTRPNSRGRPRASGESSEDIREDILQAAATLFSTKGVSGTRIAHIAEAVGLKSPSVYYHFSDIDEIVHHLIEFVVNDSMVFATSIAADSGSPRERLGELLEYHLSRLISSNYDLWFIASESGLPKSLSPHLTKNANRWRKAVSSLVNEGIKAGDFQKIDQDLALGMITGMIWGALSLKHQKKSVAPSEVVSVCISALT